MKKLRTIDMDRYPGRLPALILAAGLCLAVAAPALADFDSAVAAYERGSYQEAQKEFEAAADAGDERAAPYLDKMRNELGTDQDSSGSAASTLMDSISSIFSETETTSDGSGSGTIMTDAGPSTADRPREESASSGKSADWEPWNPFDQSVEPPSLVSDVVAPQRKSIWSTIFHLPGDVTVIGLQYVAQFLDADNLGRELQIISRHSEKITLSILAGFWWLAIIKGLVGISASISRFTKAATTTMEQKRYG